MRNYTLNTEEKWGALTKINSFTDNQVKALLERHYTFSEMFQTYRKHVAGFTEIVLDLDKKKLYFYRSKFFTPAELNYYVTDKNDLDKIRKEVKWLRDNGYFTQKR